MLFESLLIILMIGAILVFFYRQAVTEFNILQVESLEKVFPVLGERCPIVVYPFTLDQTLWTREDFEQRPGIYTLPMGDKTLQECLAPNATPTLQSPQQAEKVAEQVGLSLWSQEHIYKPFYEHVWWSPFLSTRTEAHVGAQGLRATYAYATVLICTEGELSVSLLTEAADTYLPVGWQNKQLRDFTRNDTPHLEKIQYVDIVLEKGSALVIPPHWRVCFANRIISVDTVPPLAIWVEMHHPVSRLVQHVAFQRQN